MDGIPVLLKHFKMCGDHEEMVTRQLLLPEDTTLQEILKIAAKHGIASSVVVHRLEGTNPTDTP